MEDVSKPIVFWQPISKAPKAKLVLLAGVASQKVRGEGIHLSSYLPAVGVEVGVGFVPLDGSSPVLFTPGRMVGFEATHWSPMPDGPEAFPLETVKRAVGGGALESGVIKLELW